jgi:hypothetical protein
MVCVIGSKVFWRRCWTLRITGVLIFVHRPRFKKNINHVSETGCFRRQLKREDAYSVGPLRKSYLQSLDVSSSPFTRGWKQIQFPKRRVPVLFNPGRWTESINSVILSLVNFGIASSKYVHFNFIRYKWNIYVNIDLLSHSGSCKVSPPPRPYMFLRVIPFMILQYLKVSIMIEPCTGAAYIH